MTSRTSVHVGPLTVVAIWLAASAGPAGGATVGEVEQAWRARQERVHSFDLAWDNRCTVRARAFSFPFAAPVPVETTVYETSFELSFVARDAIRSLARFPAGYRSQLEMQEHTWVQGGDHGYRWLSWSGARGYYEGYQGRAGSAAPAVDDDFQLLLPVMLIFRPFDNPLAQQITSLESRFELVPGEQRIDERACVALAQTSDPPSNTRLTLWVDPERDHVPVQLERWRGETMVSRLKFDEYARADGEWVPLRWRVRLYDRDGVRMEQSAVLQRYAVNEPIDGERFVLEFPVGTRVTAADGERYILRHDGKRVITHDEFVRGADYFELLATEPGEAVGGSPGRTDWWFWGFVLSVAGLFTTALVLRKLRRSASGRGDGS